MPFLEFAIKHGDPQAKENAAALLYTRRAPLLQAATGPARARPSCSGWRSSAANPTGKVAAGGELPARPRHTFQVPQIDPQAEKQKSCDLARQEEALLAEAETALTAGRAVNQEAVDKNLGIIKQYKPRVASMLKAYCK